MIVDVVLFDDEFDVLDCRLNELRGVVDRFILCEANAAFSGVPKPYHLTAADDRYPDVTIVRADTLDATGHRTRSMPWIRDDTTEFWWREDAQRNAARSLVAALPGDTIVMYGDLDEIPRRSVVERFRGDPRLLMMTHLVYSTRQYKTDPWPGTVIGRRTDLGDDVLRVRDHRLSYAKIHDAGWHLSWFGGEERWNRKLAHTAHQELAGADLAATMIHVDGVTALEPYTGDLPSWVAEEWT